MSNSDFFSLFSEDEPSSQSLTSLFDIERVPSSLAEGEVQQNLESLEDIFSHLTFNPDESAPLFNDSENLWEVIPEEVSRSQEVSAVSVLTPPLLVEHQDLLQEIAVYKQALGEAERQIEGQARRSQSTDQLIAQQAEELNKVQEHLAYTVAEFQVYQEESQRQQFQVETLAQNSATSQTRTAELERECSLLQENCEKKGHQIKVLEQQLEEVRARLQRQQRYAIQYKTALEQCLAMPNLNPSSDLTNAIASLTGQVTPIQPWSAQTLSNETTPFKFPDKHTPQELNPAIPEIPLVTTENSELMPTDDIWEINESQEVIDPVETTISESSSLESTEPETLPSKPIEKKSSKRDRSFLSFAIHPSEPKIRRCVDLPRFVRQPSVNQ
jgi:septal ring factor EnvC (AmiA/AmiB activator)